jgi:hypothetical protein
VETRLTAIRADHTRSERPKLVYIMGYGFSGSTLLDHCLGSHSQAESVGELKAYDQWRQEDRQCTCGELMSACPHWQAVEAIYRDRLGKVPGNPFDAFRPIAEGSLRLRPIEMSPSQLEAWGAKYEGLIRSVLEHSGRRVAIDSSKNPWRALALHRSGRFDLKVIYLVRRGEAVVYSGSKRGHSALRQSVGWWLWSHRALDCARILGPERVALLKYETFAAQPEVELRRLCRFAAIEYESGMLEFKARVHHNVSGNRSMKMDSRNTEISLREEWRERMNRRQRLVFEMIGGRMNRHLQRFMEQDHPPERF